ncbi:hypothetical protein S4A8_06788 [Salinisphaera sp. S4-8]|uniref:ABC-three component system middle component 7 n=1 Tax=Salinisphaera sp. S4-8 TaxID=633357 RepID=UPI00333E9C5F
MIAPTKFTSLDDSLLGKSPKLLQAFDSPISAHSLYKLVERQFEDAGEFLLTLDVLYVLGAIRLDAATGMVEKC